MNGYDHDDFEFTSRIERDMNEFSKAYAPVADQVATEAHRAVDVGDPASTARLFHRAASHYGRGQHHLFRSVGHRLRVS